MAARKKPVQPQNAEETKKTRKEIICEIIKKKSKEKFLSDNQKIYYDLLKKNQITICSGPAGTGKSYISLKAAVDLISDPNAPYEKIIILRPAVESSDSTIGLLPGDVREKMDPYVYASFYLLKKIEFNTLYKHLLLYNIKNNV